MSLLLKDPFAVLDYAVDWGDQYLDGDLIAASSWAVEPDLPGGLAIADSRFDPLVASVTVNGGQIGHLYSLTNQILLNSGREDRRSIQVRVEAR